jgi:hypothetical protein
LGLVAIYLHALERVRRARVYVDTRRAQHASPLHNQSALSKAFVVVICLFLRLLFGKGVRINRQYIVRWLRHTL